MSALWFKKDTSIYILTTFFQTIHSQRQLYCHAYSKLKKKHALNSKATTNEGSRMSLATAWIATKISIPYTNVRLYIRQNMHIFSSTYMSLYIWPEGCKNLAYSSHYYPKQMLPVLIALWDKNFKIYVKVLRALPYFHFHSNANNSTLLTLALP